MKKTILMALSLLAVALMAACGGGGSSDHTAGSLTLSLTDAPAGRYRAVYVTINEIQVHLGGNENTPNNWRSVVMPQGPITRNLLELINGLREELGLVSLSAGHYTQMRLIIGRTPDASINLLSQAHPFANYVIDQENPANVHELKVPSGHQTGVKIVRGFAINANRTTELLLDFDAGRSIVQAGASGKWLLKPTIQVVDLDHSAVITGLIDTAEDEPAPIQGAVVSAQIYRDDINLGPKDQVTVAAATITDESGSYQLFVEAGDYNLVVHAAGKQISFSEISVQPDTVHVEDRKLDTVIERRLEGEVTIVGGDTDEQYAVLSLRKAVTGANQEKMIEVQSFNQLNGSQYATGLPVNEAYTLVGSSFGYRSVTYSIEVSEDGVDQHVSITTIQ